MKLKCYSFHVLGLRWNHRADNPIVSRGTSPCFKRAFTQRVFFSLVPSVNEAIGLVAPNAVKARLLRMDIWRINGQQWDDDIPKVIFTQFLEWSREQLLLTEVAIPKSYFQETVEGLELHLLGDSSQVIFSAVAFLRSKLVVKGTGTTELAFVFGKAGVAPMKSLTFPKLELQVVLLVSRLRQDVQLGVSLNTEICFIWTDSTTVLQRLNSFEKNLTLWQIVWLTF